jgi:hypothetical protein
MASSSFHLDLLQGLDLQPGLQLQYDIWKKIHKPVGFSNGFSKNEFFLLASFGPCKFRLCPTSVGFLLQSALGSSASDFNVIQIFY